MTRQPSPEPRTVRGSGTKEGAVAAWCSTHNDLAWLYEDGSVGCYYDAVTESSNEHDAAPLAIEAEAAAPLNVDLLREAIWNVASARVYDSTADLARNTAAEYARLRRERER